MKILKKLELRPLFLHLSLTPGSDLPPPHLPLDGPPRDHRSEHLDSLYPLRETALLPRYELFESLFLGAQ
ncbi:Hypothetical protein FKW44_014129 [Caligus rogercresseyi]|uniref:Uncharacterized protein n=1 Tax=Caligus rogercresseyi TaxID=217165 RepID=A0A7T8K073_CALRO|nr:Hypothetical protein FKW44_014129 [Caligus rogercresseyi]